MVIAPIFCAAWAPTEKSRMLADDIFAALDAVYTRKEAASLLKITEKLLSDWKQLQKPLHWLRLAHLEDDQTPEGQAKAAEFWDLLQERMAARRGGVYVKPSLVTLLRAAATVKRTPLKALFSSPERKLAS